MEQPLGLIPLKRRILLLSHTGKGDVIRVGSHHLAMQMGRLGMDVVHLSLGDSCHSIIEDSVRWVELKPQVSPSVMIRMPSAFRNLLLKQLLQSVGLGCEYDYLLLDSEFFFSFLQLFKGGKVVYRPTDYKVFRAMRRQLAKVDAIVATSSQTLIKLDAIGEPKRSLVLENGVELTEFVLSEVKAPPYRNFAYLGAVDFRMDWEATKCFVESNDELSLTIGGPIMTDVPNEIKRHDRIRLLGSVPYREASNFLATFDAGFFPFNDHPMNQTRSPMKFYEFMAMGLPILASETPELKQRELPGMVLFPQGSKFEHELVDLEETYSVFADSRDKLVNKMSWECITRELLNFLQDL